MNQEPWQTKRARSLRREMTPAESKLWASLRGRRFAAIKFRRQHPVGRYVVDLFCHDLALALEIDGETHLGKEKHDEERQKAIESTGIKIIRFWNTEVYDDFEPVLDAIWRECEQRKAMRDEITENTPLNARPSPPAPLPGGEGRNTP